MKTLTIFTPTYNRAYCLHQVYESLCRQTVQDFIWLVIDDGSTDNTKKFPENIKAGKYSLLKSKYKIIGDIKFVYVTDKIKKYSEYPVFEGERFVPLGYKYSNIDLDYDMLFLNKVLCIVDYMPDGSTMNIFNQYFKHPKGFAFSRKQSLKGFYNQKEKFIIAVHLVAESILAKQNAFKNNSEKLLTFFAIPLGIALYGYILFLNKK